MEFDLHDKIESFATRWIMEASSPIAMLNRVILGVKSQFGSVKQMSDGYHTIETLYNYRALYNAGMFNSFAKDWYAYFTECAQKNWAYLPERAPNVEYNVHKSKRHNDGEVPFGNPDYFIVVAELPTGTISNHYTMDRWELFRIPEYPKSPAPYDGHTPEDVEDRIRRFLIGDWGKSLK